MRTIIPVSLITICVCLVSACEPGTKQMLAKMQAERDSLLEVTHLQDSAKNVIDAYIETIAVSLDSIKSQEQILTLSVDENGVPLKKNEIRKNLELLADIIARQREKIAQMEEELFRRGQDSTSYYRTLITHLYDQLDAKDRQIAQMEKTLEEQSRTIRSLNTRVEDLKSDVFAISQHAQEQSETIAAQTEMLTLQSNMINTGYIKIGSHRELSESGVLKKGLFSGGKINYEDLDLSGFDVVDIRDLQELRLNSRHPRILSSHPTSSYTLESADGGETVLQITNPPSFWSVSNFLVIQL